MALSQMAGDASAVMSNPGMTGAIPQSDEGQQVVDPQQQVRGAVEQLSQLRTSAKSTLEAIATQFPGASKSAKEILGAVDAAMQRLVKDIVKTVQSPDPQAPTISR